jgi:hypothetical protein
MSEDFGAILREQLLALCDAHIANSRQLDDPNGDVALVRRGLQVSRAILEATPVEPSLDDYVFNLHRLMGAEWALAMEAGEEDRNHGRAAGMRTLLDEVEEFAATLGVPPEPGDDSRKPDRTNLLTLFQSQLPLVRSLHATGSFGPLSAFMNTGGGICGEAITPGSPEMSLSATGAINRVVRRHLAALRQGSIQAGAVYFQAAVSDDGISPARSIEDPNAVIARLQNSEGAALQAIMRYRADTAPDGTTAWAYDEPHFTELQAMHVIADVSLVSISAERPEGYLWSSEPLSVVSADSAVGVTTNGGGNAMVWRMSDSMPTRLLEGHGGTILACALTANGEVAMTSSSDGTVILWDAVQGVVIARVALDTAHTEVAFSAEGDHVALLGSDGQYTCLRVLD